jgi:hypothetical protein
MWHTASMTLSMHDTQHRGHSAYRTISITMLCQYVVSLCWVWRFIYYYAECHYAECHYAMCRGAVLYHRHLMRSVPLRLQRSKIGWTYHTGSCYN